MTVRTLTVAGGLVLLGVVAYLCLWPVPAEPVSWPASTPPGYTGAHAPNTRLSGLHTIDIETEFGPEHIAIGPDGKLYAAMTSGNLLRMEPDGSNQQIFANTGGRVLGFAFDAEGRMIAADAMKGLLAIDTDGSVRLLTERVGDGDPVGYANSVVVAPDGNIYFTDSSTHFSPAQWGGTYEASVLDILEQAASGRVLAYDPVTASTRVVAHGLSFANGIVLSSDGRALFVAETGRYRIWAVDSGARDLDVRSGSEQARVLLDNLPGYPDNLMRGREGRIWVGLFRPRNSAADALSQKPFLRKVLLRLPRSMLPVGEPYGHVFAFDEGGRVTEDLQDPEGAYPETTGVTETADRLYIHSLHAPAIGWVRRDSTMAAQLEDIYILRSIREQRTPVTDGCAASKTGFEPFSTDAERSFSFWSVSARTDDGRLIDSKHTRVAELRACFGPTQDRARQNFYAEVQLDAISFRGTGECLALAIDFPESGLFPVRCHLILSGLSAPFVGGLLTTNTISSGARFGGDTEPPGYTQASIATIRLWRSQEIQHVRPQEH
ncbi:MAG TPA: SMP-30/gluconolactonase/LRE family protein [Steroidobacter sp.]|uniref:SMP-30/gluconolactonase/LRE family protein n=1 Tax=Steroidobacter sp. TaxID=1978227 RepID=UPI002ED8977C